MHTRRKFIRDCAFVAAASALVPAALAQGSFSAPAIPNEPGFEQFLRQVNTSFILQAGAKSVEVVLDEAKVIPASMFGAADAGNEKFSLLFKGPVPASLEQGIYSFDHPSLGSLSIFIVPVGGINAAQRHCEAIFNRPTRPAELAAQLARAPKRVQNQ